MRCMQSPQTKIIAMLLSVVTLSFALPATSLAGKTKFPADHPAFTVDFPSGWKAQLKGGNLSSTPPGDAAYTCFVVNLPDVKSMAELKARLPEVVKSATLKNIKLGVIRETESDTMQFLEVNGRGESDGEMLVVTMTGFQVGKGRFFAMLGFGTHATQKKYGKDYEAIAASIQPL